MTKIIIESKTEGYIITKDTDQYAVSSTDMMVRRVKALFGVTPTPKDIQKGQDTPDIRGPVYHKEDNEIKDPDKSINVKNELPNSLPAVDIPPAPTDQENGDMIEFQELKISLPKYVLKKLYGDRKSTDKHNLTYYSSEDGGLIIQYGTNRCYTTWDDLHKLPYPVPGEILTKLNSQKKLGVKAFKDWMVRQAEMSKTEDPDADLKPLISKYQNTGTNYDGGSIDEVD